MCGIVGFIDYKNNTDAKILSKMTNSLLHRGPDDGGEVIITTSSAKIGLGHRRLSIIDLSPLGHQPMSSFNDKYIIIFNGEIYNYKEIQLQLIELGYKFSSTSDTEVILSAFDCWGVDAVQKFIGMFSFLLWDKENEKLLCFRDRAGVKPLYFYKNDGLILFASELKAFHEHPLFKKEISKEAVKLYFSYGYIPAPYTIFEGASKIKPGHYLIIDVKNNIVEEHKYWDVFDYYKKPSLKISEEDALAEIESLLQSACQYRLVSDVPVGVFLSGGYDSSIVAAMAQASQTSKIKTFTIGFADKGFDESGYARKVAKHLGTEHTEYICTKDDAAKILPTLPFFYDEPFGDSSAIPTMLVSELAKRSVTVALSADAGDETFVGYTKYDHVINLHSKLKKVPKIVKSSTAFLMNSISANLIPFSNRFKNFETRYIKFPQLLRANGIVEINKEISKHFNGKEISMLLKDSNKKIERTFFDEIPLTQNDVDILLAIDYKTYMADDILVKVDRATMSVSLEGREPLLDQRLTEFVAQIPQSLKYKNGVKKYLLKEITHKYLPKEMMDRPKMGFGIPVLDWLKSDLESYVCHYFSETFIIKQNLFNYAYINKIKESHLASVKSNNNQIWLLLMFQMWWEKWMQ